MENRIYSMSSTSPDEKLLTILLVDARESVLDGAILALSQRYQTARIIKARTAQDAITKIENLNLNLVIMDLLLSKNYGETVKSNTGIHLLKYILQNHPCLNVVVQSANVKSLIRLDSHQIYEHKAGFTVADKSASLQNMLDKVDWSVQGLVYLPKNVSNSIEFKKEWVTLLELAFAESLQDKEIAKRMNIAERTVRHYWSQIQKALNVAPETGKNMRIKTEISARKEGLID